MTGRDPERHAAQQHEVRAAYSALARPYIDGLGAIEHVHVEDVQLIDRHLAGPGGPVLDLGCGPGHLSGHLAAGGASVTGIDLVPEFVEHARATYPGASFELGSLTRLRRPGASVGGALAWYSLIHLDPVELGPAMTEIRRVLVPGSAFVVGFFAGARVEAFDHKVSTAYRWPVKEMERRLSAHGFRVVERLERPQHGDRRPHAAMAARAL